MPDRDWYDRHLPRNWRRVARCVEKGGGIVQTSKLAFRSLAKTLRETQGVSGMSKIIELVHEYNDRKISIPETFALLRQACLSAGGSDLTQFAKQAAESTIVAIDRCEVTRELTLEVYCRFQERVFEGCLFGPARIHWVPSRFATPSEANDWQRQCLGVMAPHMEKFSEALLRHPSGTGLRAPARVNPRERTADLISQPLT